MEELLQRQLEIYRRLANGETQVQVGKDLGISQQQMHHYFATVMVMAGVKNPMQFARMYWEWEQRRLRAAAD
jgi:DNA-binding NarL/FixJ family response regulator